MRISSSTSYPYRMGRLLSRLMPVLLMVWTPLPSFQMIISPCKVDNFMTQPHYATSLTRKGTVQIVQIPPVFTQNVMVGRCVNATSEISPTPGTYFVCKQRYSSVEVYTMEPSHNHGFHSNTDANFSSALYSTIEKFRAGNFIRESVVVESGCDFTFNLLPLLFQRRYEKQLPPPSHAKEIVDERGFHKFHVLQSPYHANANHRPGPPPMPFQPPSPHQSPQPQPQIPNPYQNQPLPQAQSHTLVPHQNHPPPPTHHNEPQHLQNPPHPVIFNPSQHPQGGNGTAFPGSHPGPGPNAQPHLSPSDPNNHGASHAEAHAPPSIYQSRGGFDTDDEGGGDEGYYSNSPGGGEGGGRGGDTKDAYQTAPQGRPEGEGLYTVPDKIGVPLYILSPKMDPLLSNIDPAISNADN